MTQNQSFPDDHSLPAGDSTDRERLAETEQRLGSARPRPVELDVEAIVRAADVADQPVLLPDDCASGRSTRSYAWFGAIAGAWACGAIAGALLTFLLLNQTVPPEGPNSESIAAQRDQSPEIARGGNEESPDDEFQAIPSDEPPSDETRPSSLPKSHDFVALLDRDTREATSYETRRPILRAGEFAHVRASADALHVPDFPHTMVSDRVEVSNSGSEARRGWMPHSVPDMPVTRKRLLQELLGAGSESLL